MSAHAALIDVCVARIRTAAEEMKLYDLAALNGAALPPVEPGAHIDVHLGNGMTRQYSLVNSGAAPSSYVIGVKREAGGKGGSRWLHDEAVAGQALKISMPRNHFALNPKATHSILVAGGIGITPIWNMATALQAQGRSWELHYGCRSKAHCAFHDQLAGLGNKVHFYFDDELGPGAINFNALAAKALGDAGTDLYCCGPQGMLGAFELGCSGLPAGRAHLEHFSAPAADPSAANGSFTVVLARTGKEILVPTGLSILECLTAVGIDVPYSCSQGVCGSCETRVIAGTPDHRDVVLSEAERAANLTMMVCCSRAHSPRLTLDL